MKRILLFGFGVMGKKHADTIMKSKESKLIGVVDPNNLVSNEYNYLDFYSSTDNINFKEQVDAVIVSSTTNTHYLISENILNYNLPLLIEKPVSTNLAETKKIINLCIKSKNILQVGFVELFNPTLIFFNSLNINSFDEIKIIRSSPAPSISRNLENVLFDITIHDIAILENLLGLKNLNIKNYSVKNKNNKITEASIFLKSKETNIEIFSSINSQKTERSWTIKKNDDIYKLDLLNKKIFINDKETKIPNNISALELQLNHFLKRIDNNELDKEYLNSVYKIHKFIYDLQ